MNLLANFFDTNFLYFNLGISFTMSPHSKKRGQSETLLNTCIAHEEPISVDSYDDIN